MTFLVEVVGDRADDIAAIVRDRRFGRDWPASLDAVQGPGWEDEPIWQYTLETMLFLNPPKHTAMRALFTRAFSAKVVYAMEDRMRAICDECFHDAIATQPFDFCEKVALPFPVRVVCEMTGVPPVDTMRVARLVERLLLSFEIRPLSRKELDLCNAALAELETLFVALLLQRRAEPRDDLLTMLAAAAEDEKLDDRLVAWNLIHVFAAAFETTAGVMGNALQKLLATPGAWEELREGGVTDEAVEELLRYDLSTQIGGRNALERIDYGGHAFEVGDVVFLALGAACRDEAVYPDADRLDLTRPVVKPLVFGGGIHMCLGALLARKEMRVCIEGLLERFATLELESGFEARYRPTATIRMLERLPILWTVSG